MFLIRPRPIPPYWPVYPEPQRSALEAEYRKLDAEWQREASRAMWLDCITVMCATIAGIVAALLGPGIVLDAILIMLL